MKIIDLNLVLYATNRDAPNHAKASEWWNSCLSGTETIGLPWVVLLGFIRISTNSRVMPLPLSCEQATEITESWLEQEVVEIVKPSDRHWSILKQLLLQLGTAANLTTDAHLAALAIEKGADFYSTDNDFSRFPHLKWINPLSE